MKKNKKSKKWLRKFGNANADWAADYLGLGRSKRELADELGITLAEMSQVEEQSEKFRSIVERGVQRNLSKDLRFIKENADNKSFNVQAMKAYMLWNYGLTDKPMQDGEEDNKEFGFDIVVRPKE